MISKSVLICKSVCVYMSLHLYMQVGRCIITMNNMHDKDKFLRMSIEVHGLYIVHACKCAAGKFI